MTFGFFELGQNRIKRISGIRDKPAHPPGAMKVRVAMVRMSSEPLPQRIMSGERPNSLAAASRNDSPTGLG